MRLSDINRIKGIRSSSAHCLGTGNRHAFPGRALGDRTDGAPLDDKGLMAKVDMDGTKCGGCTACADGIKRHYEWLGPQSVTFVKKS